MSASCMYQLIPDFWKLFLARETPLTECVCGSWLDNAIRCILPIRRKGEFD